MARLPKDSSDRMRTLRTLEYHLERPMIALAFAWLVLMVVDLTRGLSPLWQQISIWIWIVFILEFLLKLVLAPDKLRFLVKNWLTALSLLVPALRIFRTLRFLRVARAVRGAQVVRVIGSLNRGMRALSSTMGRRGFGYVAILTTLVAFGGAAGMYAFEREHSGFQSYGEALWWTSMILTTSGSGYWPESNEGRVPAFALALYAFSVFGYVAATLASFFVERDAAAPESDLIGREQYDAIMSELAAIRAHLERTHGAQLP